MQLAYARGLSWLDPSELRVGLGCMRLPADEALALETVAAAVAAGVTVFDTARAYVDNERLVARALRQAGAADRARIVTKGGMARHGAAFVPDGRAKALRADCEASLAALDGLPVDLYLVHAPDPRTPWTTTVRALARLADEGLVRRVGVSNVNRSQLDAALELAPVAAVQVALSVFDDRALRGGVVERCSERGIAVIAHSPLGGPGRARRLARRPELAEVAAALEATPAEVAIAWLLDLSAFVVPIPGARRPETARSVASAATLQLDERGRAALGGRPAVRRAPRRPDGRAEVVLVMGIPGAGKTRLAAGLVERGYRRLNRDERGGSLREVADALEHELSSGARRIVLDNTYLTRAARSHVVDAAARSGVPVRCLWLDTPVAQAQINLVERLLERFGALPSPEVLKADRQPGGLLPTSQLRAVRELEPPSADEGFASVERVAFERAARAGGRPGLFVAAAALRTPGFEGVLGERAGSPCLVFDWRPEGVPADLDAQVERVAGVLEGVVEAAVCPHGGGPPRCWCRPPLPGLVLGFARRHGVDPARSTLLGTGPAHRTLAAALDAVYREAPD